MRKITSIKNMPVVVGLALTCLVGCASSGSDSSAPAPVDAAKIESMLKSEPKMQGAGVTVQVSEKTVTLGGMARNAEQKSIAESVAKTMAPGHTVQNNVQVGG